MRVSVASSKAAMVVAGVAVEATVGNVKAVSARPEGDGVLLLEILLSLAAGVSSVGQREGSRRFWSAACRRVSRAASLGGVGTGAGVVSGVAADDAGSSGASGFAGDLQSPQLDMEWNGEG